MSRFTIGDFLFILVVAAVIYGILFLVNRSSKTKK
jgi:hypothetical protein